MMKQNFVWKDDSLSGTRLARITTLLPDAGAGMTLRMDGKQLLNLVKYIELLFDEVRLVHMGDHCALAIDGEGCVSRIDAPCFARWSRREPCEGCISGMSELGNRAESRMELVGNELFCVKTLRMEVNGLPCALEMANRVHQEINDDMNQILQDGCAQQDASYADPVTGLYNQRFFYEQLRGKGVAAVAMLSLNEFNRINEICGHLEGGRVLRRVGMEVSACVRKSDNVLRYRGEDFMLVFQNIPKDVLASKLESIRRRVEAVSLDGYPGLCLHASIGGKYGPGQTEALAREAERLARAAREVTGGVCVG